MKSFAITIAVAALFASCVQGSVDEEKALAALRDVDAFKASLPAKLVVAGFGDDGKMPERFLKFLAGPGAPELYALPEEAKAPRPIGGKIPLIPDEYRQQGVGGQADYLILISSSGRVVSIVEVSRSEPSFALGVARSLTKFRFEPCQVNGMKVPVVVHFGLQIDLDKEKLSRGRKTAQPGATDNPDDAQRLREDH